MNRSIDEPRPTTRWAVDLAVVAIGLVPATFAIVALIFAIGGPSPLKDTWTGFVGLGAVYVGIGTAFVAFVLAVISKARREFWDAVWLPLALFPALVGVMALTGFWVD